MMTTDAPSKMETTWAGTSRGLSLLYHGLERLVCILLEYLIDNDSDRRAFKSAVGVRVVRRLHIALWARRKPIASIYAV